MRTVRTKYYQILKEYDDKKLMSATKEGLKLDDETEEEKQKKEEKSLLRTCARPLRTSWEIRLRSLEEPNTFAARIHRMLKLGLSIDEEETGGDDADMPALEEDATEESKMEEVD
nr:heat shock protein 83 [Quercus suber]